MPCQNEEGGQGWTDSPTADGDDIVCHHHQMTPHCHCHVPWAWLMMVVMWKVVVEGLAEFPLTEFSDILSRKGLRWLVCIA